jgi:hypothetical protein
MSQTLSISNEDRLIEYLKPLYYHDYYKDNWYMKQNGTQTFFDDMSQQICSPDAMGSTFGNENEVAIMLFSEYVRVEMTPNHILETNFLFPQLLDAIIADQPLKHCLQILEENPSTVYATDKYGNNSLYHIIERCLLKKTISIDQCMTLFNRILDRIGVVGFPRTSAEERILYLATSRKCVKRYPSFLKTLIRRGLNVNYIFPTDDHLDSDFTIMIRLLYDSDADELFVPPYVPPTVPKTVLGLIDLLLCHGADINWRSNISNDGILSFSFCESNSDYDVCQYLLSKGADSSQSDLRHFQSCDLHKKYELVNRWPTTMAIIMLKEIGLYHHLDCDTFMDLYEFTSVAFVHGNDVDM